MKKVSILRSLIAATALITAQANAAETIVVKGSDTLGAKMVPQLAEAFKAKMADRGVEVAFEIAAEGSSTGVASVIDGTAEIGMSSRDPKDKEVAKAKTKGVDMKTITVAKDGIAIIVNEANPLDSISLDEIELIFSGDVTDWSGITAQTGEISAYTRNTSSGTYAVFQKLGMKSRDYGADTQKMAGNEQIAAEVAKNPNGIGYVGLAYINTPGVKVLPVDGHQPDAKAYPLARPLYYLINKAETISPIANDFIGFSMSPEGQAIVNKVHFLSIY
ncbi:phosphate-binding protein [Coraliomargarita sinensis]|uniref:Phosphate-binding protein n=1 Tax=Coraliomargarita sinensis TaxID=2174842 RepID=A0A317ZEJ1_9BACT|nr:phosphate ABC transporter substrate-binding protein [Coraliomargarita sinensis]PXA03766.1 phosphate-binding protein [Coraliomargarita sinensis]